MDKGCTPKPKIMGTPKPKNSRKPCAHSLYPLEKAALGSDNFVFQSPGEEIQGEPGSGLLHLLLTQQFISTSQNFTPVNTIQMWPKLEPLSTCRVIESFLPQNSWPWRSARIFPDNQPKPTQIPIRLPSAAQAGPEFLSQLLKTAPLPHLWEALVSTSGSKNSMVSAHFLYHLQSQTTSHFQHLALSVFSTLPILVASHCGFYSHCLMSN